MKGLSSLRTQLPKYCFNSEGVTANELTNKNTAVAWKAAKCDQQMVPTNRHRQTHGSRQMHHYDWFIYHLFIYDIKWGLENVKTPCGILTSTQVFWHLEKTFIQFTFQRHNCLPSINPGNRPHRLLTQSTNTPVPERRVGSVLQTRSNCRLRGPLSIR